MKSLSDYESESERVIRSNFNSQLAETMLADEDARSFFIYHLQMADWDYDPERCGSNYWAYKKNAVGWMVGKYRRKLAKPTAYHLFTDLEMTEVSYDPAEDIEEAEDRIHNRQFITKLFAEAGLSALQKTILRLRYYDGLTNYEIGDQIGRSANQVSVIACEGMRLLKERHRGFGRAL